MSCTDNLTAVIDAHATGGPLEVDWGAFQQTSQAVCGMSRIDDSGVRGVEPTRAAANNRYCTFPHISYPQASQGGCNLDARICQSLRFTAVLPNLPMAASTDRHMEWQGSLLTHECACRIA